MHRLTNAHKLWHNQFPRKRMRIWCSFIRMKSSAAKMIVIKFSLFFFILFVPEGQLVILLQNNNSEKSSRAHGSSMHFSHCALVDLWINCGLSKFRLNKNRIDSVNAYCNSNRISRGDWLFVTCARDNCSISKWSIKMRVLRLSIT